MGGILRVRRLMTATITFDKLMAINQQLTYDSASEMARVNMWHRTLVAYASVDMNHNCSFQSSNFRLQIFSYAHFSKTSLKQH